MFNQFNFIINSKCSTNIQIRVYYSKLFIMLYNDYSLYYTGDSNSFVTREKSHDLVKLIKKKKN